MEKLKIGIHTDAISDDLEHTLYVVRDMGLKYIDLRGIWGKNIIDLSDEDVKHAKALVKKYGIEVACISSWPFLNLPLREREDEVTYFGSYLDHFKKLQRAVELADIFDTKFVRCFSFQNTLDFSTNLFYSFDPWEKTVERFQKPAQLAEKADIILALESCFFAMTGTGLLVRKLIEDVGSKNIRLLWDPINSFYASGEDPYPYEYEEVKNYIVYIDVKDKIINKRLNLQEHCLLGQGNKIDWPPILNGLVNDSYQGVITLETRYAPEGGTLEDGARKQVQILRQMISTL